MLIPRLKEAGIAVAMMTGDNRRTAEAVAHDLGIERVFAEVRPELMCCAARRGADRSAHVWSVASCVSDGGCSELLGCALQGINDVKR